MFMKFCCVFQQDKANASPNFKLGAKKVDAGPAAMAGGMDKVQYLFNFEIRL